MKLLHPRTIMLLTIFIVLNIFVLGFWTKFQVMTRDAIYLARPLWDTPAKRPQIVIPHFYAHNLPVEMACTLHNWTKREEQVPAVIDAVVFSMELDILEIRLKELWSVVEKFVVIESNLTFTGKPKPLFLEKAISGRFKWAEDKLVYYKFYGLDSDIPEGDTFHNEMLSRDYVYSVLTSEKKVGLRKGDIVIISDVDEIPSRNTIALLKACKGYPHQLHLEMNNYLYSFEYYVDRLHWRPSIAVYEKETFEYNHQCKSDYILADAGWHCSFCFRYLSDFVFKMLSYSHSDRVTNSGLLNKKNIQDKICRGADIFDMYPEGYTYKQLISKMGDIVKTDSTRNIPEYVVRSSETFKFLLPGGCKREDDE